MRHPAKEIPFYEVGYLFVLRRGRCGANEEFSGAYRQFHDKQASLARGVRPAHLLIGLECGGQSLEFGKVVGLGDAGEDRRTVSAKLREIILAGNFYLVPLDYLSLSYLGCVFRVVSLNIIFSGTHLGPATTSTKWQSYSPSLMY